MEVKPGIMLSLDWIQSVLTLMVFLKDRFGKVDFIKKPSPDDKKHVKLPGMQREDDLLIHC